MRKDLQAKAVAVEPEAKPEAADEEGEDGKEVALLAEMSTLKEAADRRMKKEKKRKREAKTKARVRAAQMALGASTTAPPPPPPPSDSSNSDQDCMLTFP